MWKYLIYSCTTHNSNLGFYMMILFKVYFILSKCKVHLPKMFAFWVSFQEKFYIWSHLKLILRHSQMFCVVFVTMIWSALEIRKTKVPQHSHHWMLSWFYSTKWCIKPLLFTRRLVNLFRGRAYPFNEQNCWAWSGGTC